MCVYIVQYYAINLMFNSDRVAAFVSGSKGRAAPGTGSPAALAVPLSIWKKGAAFLSLGPTAGERPSLSPPCSLGPNAALPLPHPGLALMCSLLNESMAGWHLQPQGTCCRCRQ